MELTTNSQDFVELSKSEAQEIFNLKLQVIALTRLANEQDAHIKELSQKIEQTPR